VKINKYPFLSKVKAENVVKVSRDDKGRASSIEIDARSKSSLQGKNENLPTTTSNDEDKILLSKKQSILRRGRSIESIDKTFKDNTQKALKPEVANMKSTNIDKKRFSSPNMQLTFQKAAQVDVLSESYSSHMHYSDIESISQLSNQMPSLWNNLAQK
jgi:hypothetical protein